MSSITLAFSQIQSTGRLTGQDLLQLVNAGFNPLKQISADTRLSIAALKKKMEKGAISAQMVEDAFMNATQAGGQFYQMSEKMAQTMGGRWSTLMDKLSVLLLKISDAIAPVFEALITALTVSIDKVSELFAYFQEHEQIAWGLAAVMGILSARLIATSVASASLAAIQGIASAATSLWTGLVWALNAAFWANPVTWIVAGIVALIAAIVIAVKWTEGWGKQWDVTLRFIANAWDTFILGIKAYIATWVNAFTSAIDAIKLGYYKFKKAVGLGDEQENQAMIQQLQKSIQDKAVAITYAWEQVKQKAIATKNSWSWEVGWKKVEKHTKEKETHKKENTNKNVNINNTSKNITEGGRQQKNISINMKNLIEKFEVSATSVQESAGVIEDKVKIALLQALNSINAMA